jgi:hypothetical protein
MKKILLSIAAIMALSLSVFAQWGVQNTGMAESRGIQDIIAVDASVVWAAAYDGTAPTGACSDFCMTTDGGTTWVPGTITNTTGLANCMIYAVDATHAWVPMFKVSGTKPQGIYYTSDGGTTWARQTTALFSNSASFPDCVHFWDLNVGWCMGDPISGEFEIYTTTDGGTTWVAVPGSQIPDPLSGEFGVIGYYSAVNDTIWFGTNLSRVYKSVDKGHNWTVSAVTPLGSTYVQPFFKNGSFGLCQDKGASTTGTMASTTDGGTTWTIVGSTGNVFTNDMAYIPGTTSTWVTTGADVSTPAAGVTFSYDDGLTWTDMDATIGTQFLATDWVNSSTGWAGSFVTGGTGGMYVFQSNLVPPVPGFSASDTAIALGGSVTFTNNSTGALTYHWVFEGGTPGSSNLATPPAITYSLPGAYNVSLTATGDFGSQTLTKVDYIYVGGVGINDNSAASLTVYPNPVTDVVNIKGTSEIRDIQVVNLVGQVVLTQQVNSKNISINTSNLKSGVYNLKVRMDDGFVSRKIVVN